MTLEIRAVYYENDEYIQSYSDIELPLGITQFKRIPDAYGVYIKEENNLLRWLEDFKTKEEAEIALLKPRIYLQLER